MTSAAVIMVPVFSILGTLSLIQLKMLGVGPGSHADSFPALNRVAEELADVIPGR